jgi:hypothetical protein
MIDPDIAILWQATHGTPHDRNLVLISNQYLFSPKFSQVPDLDENL